jgi:hypothetical protein
MPDFASAADKLHGSSTDRAKARPIARPERSIGHAFARKRGD